MHQDWNEEVAHLESIVRFIALSLKQKLGEKDHLIREQAEINRSMWEDSGDMQDLESISDFMQHIGMLKQNMAWSRQTARDIVRLDKQLSSPYFGRIDFAERDSNAQTIYIGINTLTDDENSRILVYDWRAPVCSMFYDFETGPAFYRCPAGIIEGKITLKRQYRVEGGKLILMFDSSLAINDKILQELLASNTGSKMRSIVSTIQREQNAAIRDESTRLLAIQGAAGSGKTSVALHRASYLLYRHKKQIKTDNLVILSSTDVLGDYISDVLPELGEDEIKGITFKNVAAKYLPYAHIRIQSHPQLLEQVLTTDPKYRKQLTAQIAFKSSRAFLTILERFYDYALDHLFHFEDLSFRNHPVISEKELHQLFYQDFSRMPPLARLKRIENRINETLKPLKRSHQEAKASELESQDTSISTKEARMLSRINLANETQSFYDGLNKMMSINALSLYNRLFEDDAVFEACFGNAAVDPELTAFARHYTQENLRNRLIGMEDAGPLLYLALLLGEVEPDDSVKHLLVDEAQDYAIIQLTALKRLFPQAGITILGDISQNISPYASFGNLEELARYLSPTDNSFIQLNKSYRSTAEISAFSAHFQHGSMGENFGRHGDKPVIHLMGEPPMLEEALETEILSRLSEGSGSIAVITRSMADADRLYQAMKKRFKAINTPFRLMKEDYEYPIEGVMVMPSYLAKGLEFDCVLAVLTHDRDYCEQDERGLLYTVLSRALHHLAVFCPGDILSEPFRDVDPESYVIKAWHHHPRA
jgi:DNA helicase-2/ATP-dependent DNA helicase PcrA